MNLDLNPIKVILIMGKMSDYGPRDSKYKAHFGLLIFGRNDILRH